MAGRITLLTPERHKAIVSMIRAGAYDWVSAEANGIDKETFKLWLRVGERERREPYLSFLVDVRNARAQARVAAEIEVRKDQPFNWLRFGPGRERQDAAGWTESKEVRHSGSVEVIHSTEWARISTTIELALDPFPDAKLAVARSLRMLALPAANETDPTVIDAETVEPEPLEVSQPEEKSNAPSPAEKP